MSLTAVANAKGLRSAPSVDLAGVIAEQLESLKWFLRHGSVLCALHVTDDLMMDLDIENPGPEHPKLAEAGAEGDANSRATPGPSPATAKRYRGAG